MIFDLIRACGSSSRARRSSTRPSALKTPVSTFCVYLTIWAAEHVCAQFRVLQTRPCSAGTCRAWTCSATAASRSDSAPHGCPKPFRNQVSCLSGRLAEERSSCGGHPWCQPRTRAAGLGSRPRWRSMRAKSSPLAGSIAAPNGAPAALRNSPSGTASARGRAAAITSAGSS
jgi:hypothetical protein